MTKGWIICTESGIPSIKPPPHSKMDHNDQKEHVYGSGENHVRSLYQHSIETSSSGLYASSSSAVLPLQLKSSKQDPEGKERKSNIIITIDEEDDGGDSDYQSEDMCSDDDDDDVDGDGDSDSEKEESQNKEGYCVVCLRDRACNVIRPCKHMALCDACSHPPGVQSIGWIVRCPICRIPVEEIERVFLP